MQEERPHQSRSPIQEPDHQRSYDETTELRPVAIARTKEDHSHNVMHLAKDLITACPTHSAGERKHDDECYENHSHHSPNHVRLLYEAGPHLWLRLVQLTLDNSPANRVHGGLDVDDVADPSVQGLKVLVGNAGQ